MARKILIVGGGPGGLTAGMLLAHKGYEVHIYEKDKQLGGRNAPIRLGPYVFDTGPTFLMMVQVLEEIFSECGLDLHKHLDLKKIDPLYRLRFHGNRDFFPTGNEEKMLQEIERLFPGDSGNFLKYKENEGKKLDRVYPCLTHPYLHWYDYFNRNFLRALPCLDALSSVYKRLSSYFQHEDLRIAMTFQAKYLGMSPWQCPATFTILSLIEHRWGIFHPIGGLNAISAAMGKAIQNAGGHIHLETPVKKIVIENRTAKGLLLTNGQTVLGDSVIMNPDFAWAMSNLVDASDRKKYTDQKLSQLQYSCSTFMMYLGVDKQYNIPHHNIIFAQDYRKNVNEIVTEKCLSNDPSFYIQNPSLIDPTLAPKGHSALYILVPTPNRTAPIDWEKEKIPFRNKILALIREKTELTDLDAHIAVEKVITPLDWEKTYHLYQGATFNLSHIISQMLYLRPRNRFEEFAKCYLVGGGTHPGSGLPTIYQSGRIAASLIQQD